jgi:oligopeptide/dipeptide ABC transporter ATP-binding protein
VIVMYAGEVVEEAPVGDLFAMPQHPYTEGLLEAMPRVGRPRERLTVIPGTVPPATDWPIGCRFRDRCPYAWERCALEHPPLYGVRSGHLSRCHLAEEPGRRTRKHVPLAALLGEGRSAQVGGGDGQASV